MNKLYFSFITWLIGAYLVLFAACLYVHVNESNIIANRAYALLPTLTRDNQTGLIKVAAVQRMKRKSKPNFWQPGSVINSLVGEGHTDKTINRVLGRAIERIKGNLKGSVLAQIDLSEADLSKGNLEEADLTKTNLVKANLKGANLGFANLTKSNLINANLREADLHGARISNANLQGVILNHANFIDSKLDFANFFGVNLKDVNLYRANLSNTMLKGANLSTTVNLTCEQIKSAVIDKNTKLPDYIFLKDSSPSNFNCVNLHKGKPIYLKSMNLSKAYFYTTDLRGANLSQANLKGANLRRATNVTCEQIKSAVIDKNTKLPDYIFLKDSSPSNFNCINLKKGKAVHLKGINLSKFFLVQVDLQGANLSQASLMETVLSFSNLSDTDLSHANFEGAKLAFTNLNNANLRQANLKGANLTRATNVTCEQIKSAVIGKNTNLPDYIFLKDSSPSNFNCINLMKGKAVHLKGVNLSKFFLVQVDLQGANLSDTDLSHANFEDANLASSNLNNANLSQANLKGANLTRATNVTCEQIKSAVIDKNTNLPDYISLYGTLESSYACKINLKKN
jgi:uncharacterized protein YjbI with pentapeptide repeats